MHPESEREFDLYLLAGIDAALDAADGAEAGLPDGGLDPGTALPSGPEGDAGRARFARLMADWREVLDLPSGAGLRLLRHLREQALTPGRVLAPGPEIYANAALADFLREREAEAAMAHPRRYLEFMTLAARAFAREAAQTVRRR